MSNEAVVAVSEWCPGVALISLNRPEKRNAMNAALIQQLTRELEILALDKKNYVVVITGQGEHFCAGADIGWMQQIAKNSYDDNVADAKQLALLLHTLNTFPKPTIALIHGATLGGGLGVIACCDIAIAAKNSSFCFSEVKIGLTPSVISPYIIAAIGERAARYYFLTAEKFGTDAALQMGLIHKIVSPDELNTIGFSCAQEVLKNSPHAVSSAKSLIAQVAQAKLSEELLDFTAKHLATMRASTDAQEGLHAFLEKRVPIWG